MLDRLSVGLTAARKLVQSGELARSHPSVAGDLRGEARYFYENQRRMQYLELREDGFPIGSGMVEIACKQFGARFNGPGMRCP
jgi:hypothetical protein